MQHSFPCFNAKNNNKLGELTKMQDQVILRQVTKTKIAQSQLTRPRSKFGLFSLVLFSTLLYGIYQWYLSFQTYIQVHPWDSLDHYQMIQILQFDNSHTFEQTVLKFKIYLTFTVGFIQPNIVMALCIIFTFPFLINSIERQTATSVVFYEFNGCSIYLQLVRLGLDGIQYYLTGRCYCLSSGLAAVWMNMLIKKVYHRLPYYISHRAELIPFFVTFLAACAMIIFKARLDLFLAIVIAILEITLLGGGTVKYPKQVFQEKQEAAEYIKLSKLGIWHPFRWNDYKENQYMCLDTDQFYVTKEERMVMIQ